MKAKTIAAIVLSALSVLFLVGAYVLQYFAARRLGMVRWLNARGQKLNDALSPEILWCVLLVIAVALLAFALWRMWKRSAWHSAPLAVGAVYAFVVTVALAIAAFCLTRSVTPAYFLIIPLIGLASLFQSASLLLQGSRSREGEDDSSDGATSARV